MINQSRKTIEHETGVHYSISQSFPVAVTVAVAVAVAVVVAVPVTMSIVSKPEH
jgi:hypothetical protein